MRRDSKWKGAQLLGCDNSRQQYHLSCASLNLDTLNLEMITTSHRSGQCFLFPCRMCQDMSRPMWLNKHYRTAIFRTGNNTARRSTCNPHSRHSKSVSKYREETIKTIVQERARARERERERREITWKSATLRWCKTCFSNLPLKVNLATEMFEKTHFKFHLPRDASSENALFIKMSQIHLRKFIWWSVVKHFGATNDFK